MRRVLPFLIAASVASAGAVACGPKVHPLSTFDEDDPRAGGGEDAAVAPSDAGVEVVSDAARPPGVRTGTLTRVQVDAVLDAGPAELLRGIEVTALRPDGAFTGWRLVRFVAGEPSAKLFDGVDVDVGDVLRKLNGHSLETPPDLSALWLELYRATAIDVTLDRGGQAVQLHYEIME